MKKDQDVQNYLNLLLNYNKRLEEKGTNWLGPEDLGDVLLKTAVQNGMKLPPPGKGGQKDDR